MGFLDNLFRLGGGGHHGGYGGKHGNRGYPQQGYPQPGYPQGTHPPTGYPPATGGRACPNCNVINNPDAKFCQQCGGALQQAPPRPVACAGCGAALGAAEKFCSQCGQPRPGATP